MRKVSVLSVRYDGSPRDRFDAELLDATNGVYRVGFAAGTAIETPSGIINEVTDCTQILFADRWYNVNHFHEVVPPHRNLWYANLAMPAHFDGREIMWVDLDLDVMCDYERGVLMKDEAQFAAKVSSGFYADYIVRQVYDARDEILRLCAEHSFPFDRETQVSATRDDAPPAG